MNKKHIALAGTSFLGSALSTALMKRKLENEPSEVVQADVERYHFQIVSKEDPSDIQQDSRNIPILSKGMDSYEKARDVGQTQFEYLSFNKNKYHVVVNPSKPRGYAFVNSLDDLKFSEKEMLDQAGYKILILGTEEAQKVLDERNHLPLRKGVQTIDQSLLAVDYQEPMKIKYQEPPKLPEYPQKKDKTDYSKIHKHNYLKQVDGSWMCKCGRIVNS